jgi:hypothetical protein
MKFCCGIAWQSLHRHFTIAARIPCNRCANALQTLRKHRAIAARSQRKRCATAAQLQRRHFTVAAETVDYIHCSTSYSNQPCPAAAAADMGAANHRSHHNASITHTSRESHHIEYVHFATKLVQAPHPSRQPWARRLIGLIIHIIHIVHKSHIQHTSHTSHHLSRQPRQEWVRLRPQGASAVAKCLYDEGVVEE